ncbi:MAG: efflux RND transporter periplasmic adaptor subunit [Cyclobacteriaceae bacterium]
MNRINIIHTLGLAIMLLWSCGEKKKTAEGEARQNYTCPMHPQIVQDRPGTCPICGMDLVPVDASGDKSEVTLSESQIELANIQVQPVAVQSIGTRLLLNGRIRTDETKTEVVSTRVPGRLDKLHVKQTGSLISEGQVIYEIYSEQLLTYQQEFLLANNQANTADNKRYQSYLEAAGKRLRLYGMTENQIKRLAESKHTDPVIRYVAPASGVVTEVMVSEGQYVTEGAPVYRLENLHSLWVEAELYPEEAAFVKVGDIISIHVSGYENEELNGKVTFLSPEYRQATQIFILRASIGNPNHQFVPGMQAEIALEHSKRRALAIPADAVIREEHKDHVYRKVGNGKFKAQMVTTGLENFDKVEITSGIAEGDSIVISGAYLLYSEIVLKKGVHPMAGHDHGAMTASASSEAIPTDQASTEQPVITVDSKFSDQLSRALPAYLQIKDALVASDTKAAAAAASSFSSALAKVNMGLLRGDAHDQWMSKLKILNEGAKLVQVSDDVDIQRASFSKLTGAYYGALKMFRVTGLKAYYQYCPMAFDNKGAYWISQEEQVSNPYFGEQMLRCGETKEILK